MVEILGVTMPNIPIWAYLVAAGLFTAWSAICVGYGYNKHAKDIANAELNKTITVVEQKAEIRNNRPDNAALKGVYLDARF